MPVKKYYPTPPEKPVTEEGFNVSTASRAKPSDLEDPLGYGQPSYTENYLHPAVAKGLQRHLDIQEANANTEELTAKQQKAANKAEAAAFKEKVGKGPKTESGVAQVDATKISRSATKSEVSRTGKPDEFITVMPKSSTPVKTSSEHELDVAGKTGMAFVDYPDTFEDLRRSATNPAAGRTLGDIQSDYVKYGDTFETSGADVAKARHLKGAVPNRAGSPNRQITPTLGELPE